MAGDGSSRPNKERRGSVVWPIILITVGSLFLLQNVGLLPPTFWSNIWRLWPLVLVLVGIELLFGGRVRGAPLAVLILALIGGGVALFSSAPVARLASSPWETRTFEQPLQGVTQADVRVEFGAGHLSVGALAAGGDKLSTATYEGPDELLPREPRVSVRSGRAELRYSLDDDGHKSINLLPLLGTGDRRAMTLTVALAPEVQHSLRVTTGAAESRIDLSKLKVAQLDLESGASSTWLRLPEAAGATTAQIEAGAASIEVELPEGVAAQVRYEGGLSTLDVQNVRLIANGDDRYRTADYDTNPNKVDLRIETGASSVTIR